MIILLNAIESWLLALGIILVVAALLFVLFYLISGFRKKDGLIKQERVIVDEAFITSLFTGLGGQTNIHTVSVDNGRVKFAVKDLELLVADELKKLATSGVFITGNNVKLLFKYDSNTILDALVERGVNKC